MNNSDDTRTVTISAATGRDVGKQFTVLEIDPLTLAGYALRFNSALRVDSYMDLMSRWREASQTGDAPVDDILKTLQGADPRALHELLTELLDYVRISPDPKHPGVDRPLLKDDIREMRTLGDVMLALVKLNFGTGA